MNAHERRVLNRALREARLSKLKDAERTTVEPTATKPSWERIPPDEPFWKYWWRQKKVIFSLISVVVSAFGLYVNLYPWLSIENDFFHKANDPFSAAFYIQSDGYIPLQKVLSFCDSSYSTSRNNHIGHMMTDADEPTNQKADSDKDHNIAKTLFHDQKLSVTCDSVSSYIHLQDQEPFHEGSKLSVIVDYKILGFNRHQVFPFVLARDGIGQYHWQYAERSS